MLKYIFKKITKILLWTFVYIPGGVLIACVAYGFFGAMFGVV